MKLVSAYLTDGGIPDGWTAQNLDWLAKAHRRLAADQSQVRQDRAGWHQRWATLIEDLLESHFGNNH